MPSILTFDCAADVLALPGGCKRTGMEDEDEGHGDVAKALMTMAIGKKETGLHVQRARGGARHGTSTGHKAGGAGETGWEDHGGTAGVASRVVHCHWKPSSHAHTTSNTDCMSFLISKSAEVLLAVFLHTCKVLHAVFCKNKNALQKAGGSTSMH